MSDFEPIRQLAALMDGYPHPWWVAGGWAIDLYLGRVSREHGDVEIGTFRSAQAALHEHLREAFELSKAVDGQWLAWPAEETLVAPVFQIRAVGGRAPGGELQIFLDDVAGGVWTCRRHPAITLPFADVTTVARASLGLGDVRYLRPEIQLLFKAKHNQLAKNQDDFRIAAPLLTAGAASWLRAALSQAHPGHEWIERLTERHH